MRVIEREPYTFLAGRPTACRASGLKIRQGPGHTVRTFPDLVHKVAVLAFRNPEHLLFFRGQREDHRNSKGSSSFYPEIFRPKAVGKTVTEKTLAKRYDRLAKAESLLREAFETHGLLGRTRVGRFDVVRWAIVQHYDIAPTPLLDMTQSLRVACSFALGLNAKRGFVYVFGMPQVSGSVTASSEHGVQVIRLSSICPPSARRPHHQEGYLVGEFPTITPASYPRYARKELDFSRRLICKFRVEGGSFWSSGYDPIPHGALFPDGDDGFYSIAQKVRSDLPAV